MALAAAGLRRATPLATAALLIGVNAPDVDVFSGAFGSYAPIAFRRGWTHGVLAIAVWPVVIAAALLVFDHYSRRRRDVAAPSARAGPLLAVAAVGVVTHPALDWLNNYGLRWLMPFDGRWFYGDAVFIIDPWLWLTLGTGIWLTRRRGIPIAARQGLTLAAVYIAAMCINARVARNVVLDEWRAIRGGAPVSLMAGPQPVTPFRRQVIVDGGLDYETGTLDLLSRRLTLDAVILKKDTDPRVARAREAPHIRAFLVWSRFPVWTLEETSEGTRVSVSDLRFAGRGAPFVQSVVIR